MDGGVFRRIFNGTYHTNGWPSASCAAGFRRADPAAGVSERRESVDPSTWLQTALTKTSQGLFLSWNTQPGLTYQVQVTTNFDLVEQSGRRRGLRRAPMIQFMSGAVRRVITACCSCVQ